MSRDEQQRRRDFQITRNLLENALQDGERLPDEQKRIRPAASDYFWNRLVPAVVAFENRLRGLGSAEIAELLDVEIGQRPRELSSLDMLQVISVLCNQPAERLPVTASEWEEFTRRQAEIESANDHPGDAAARFIHKLRIQANGASVGAIVSEVREAVTILDVYVSGATNTVVTNAPASPIREGAVVQPADTDSTDASESDSKAGIPLTKTPKRSKRSTGRGECRAKLIAALTMHHDYAKAGCLNLTPVGVNELAILAKVASGSTSSFFNQQFARGQKRGHDKYKVICQDAGALADAIKAMRGEFTPSELARITRESFEAGRSSAEE